MQPTQPVFVGVDVSKATLSVAIHGSKTRHELSNEAHAIGAWLDTLPLDVAIAAEATGRHHQLLIRLVHASGRRAFVLNAADVFFYAKALGARGKTDRKDAQVIARYLAEQHTQLRPWAPTQEHLAKIEELLRCRAGVATKRSSLRQLLRDVPDLQASVQALEAQFDALVAEIDAQLAAWVGQDASLNARCIQLRTITGVGPQGSIALASLFSRIEFSSSDALVAFTGLDPRPKDSGTMSGRRRLSKRGDPELRRQLYLMGFAATRSKALGPLYQQIKARGFKPTQAIIILARKLLRAAWAVWKTGKDFNPALLGGNLACAKP